MDSIGWSSTNRHWRSPSPKPRGKQHDGHYRSPSPEATQPATQPLRVLLVEDDPSDAELVLCELRSGGFEVVMNVAQTEDEFRKQMEGGAYDILLTDYSLPQWRGMEALKLLRAWGLDVPVILVTGSLGDVTAVDSRCRCFRYPNCCSRLSLNRGACGNRLCWSRSICCRYPGGR